MSDLSRPTNEQVAGGLYALLHDRKRSELADLISDILGDLTFCDKALYRKRIIVGSNGKTTTKEMLKSICAAKSGKFFHHIPFPTSKLR